ncbi:MAG TPA: carboxymuconolactone decarboxylase family protein [Gammaproteobacteria bacterium]|nr:carboxymuconolactone decarboxylase family protein [Gammaproteobacteria bacterium]
MTGVHPSLVSTLGTRVAAAVLACTALLAFASAHAAPRITPLPEKERSAEQKELAAKFASLDMANAVGTYLRYPALAASILPFADYLLNASTLPARDRELLWLRTAWLARSNYLWAHRVPAARRAGLTAAEIERIAAGPDAPGWDAFDAALLRAADELHVDSFIGDDTWKTLAARYDANQLTDLIYGVGEVTMHADVTNTLRVELEPGFTERLPNGVPFTTAARWTNRRLIGGEPRIAPLPAAPGTPGANVFRTFARNPPVDAMRNAVGRHIRDETSLMPKQRQLVIMRVGVLCRSEYEWAAHSRIGRNVGMSDADVARVIAGPASPGGTPLDTLLLRAVDELYRDNAVADDTWGALEPMLTLPQQLDVLITVGGFRSGSIAINSAGIQLDANMANFRFPPELR